MLRHSIEMTKLSILLIYISFKPTMRGNADMSCSICAHTVPAQVAALFLEKYIKGRNISIYLLDRMVILLPALACA